MSDAEAIAKLRNALGVLLGDVDYRNGACAITEQVGAVLNPQTLKVCDEAMRDTAPLANEPSPCFPYGTPGLGQRNADDMGMPNG
jgi:hypothetical protein